jgi:hypothetical protein
MRFSNLKPDHRLAGPLRRFLVNTPIVGTMLGVYMLIDHHQSASPTTVPMPSWVPFCPAFFIPYFGLMLVTWLLPVAIRDAGLFRACVWANICAWLLVMPWWILTPTIMPRPPLPDSEWAYAFYWLWASDLPYNVTPCAHGIGPIVVAWFAGRDHPTWRWPLTGMWVLGIPSIALVWQHRPVDILLGTVAAVVGIAIGETLNRREQTGLKVWDEIAA